MPDSLNRRTAVALVVILGAWCPVPAGAAQGWEANAAAFRSEMDALREPLGIPGLAYAVVHDGQVITKEALGPFTTDTPLRIASVTKALAALVALQQDAAGVLSLDARVKPLLPGFEGPDHVTLRHLLSHTSEGEVAQHGLV